MKKKIKIRQIYTVVREYSTKNLEDEEGHLLHVLDETGEFLYGGSCGEESLSVKFQINKGNKWEDYDPEQ